MKRFFAFGCSYTKYAYPTWADFIGTNFDEYYNYGTAGCSNTYIMDRLIESNHVDNLNAETDTVIVMLTGFGRYSYKNRNKQWSTNGDMHSFVYHTKDKDVEFFLEKFWSEPHAVYQSWIAAKTIKFVLEQKSIPHKILMGINNSEYLNQGLFLDEKDASRCQEIYNMLDLKLTLDEWKDLDESRKDSPFWNDINHHDGHPSQDVYLKFVKEFFPQYATDKAEALKLFWDENFDHSSQNNQGKKYRDLCLNEFNKVKHHLIF
jgi:hypothetical protein